MYAKFEYYCAETNVAYFYKNNKQIVNRDVRDNMLNERKYIDSLLLRVKKHTHASTVMSHSCTIPTSCITNNKLSICKHFRVTSQNAQTGCLFFLQLKLRND